jgi:hypothetical protein
MSMLNWIWPPNFTEQERSAARALTYDALERRNPDQLFAWLRRHGMVPRGTLELYMRPLVERGERDRTIGLVAAVIYRHHARAARLIAVAGAAALFTVWWLT